MSNSLTWMCTRARAPGFDIDVKSVDIRVNCPYESPLTHMSRMLTWMSHKTNTHMDVSCADNHVSLKVKTACTPAETVGPVKAREMT